MRKLCLMLVIFLILTGCGKGADQPPVNYGDMDSEVSMVSFDIYAINDFHGKLADTDYQPGVDELSTYLKQAQQATNTILLSTGDMWQGASESNLTNGFIITEWMNEMDFTAMTVGGHEYDWGEEWIRKNGQLAEFPFLGINVYSRHTDQRVDYCQSSVVVEIEGAKVAIIGAIGDCYSSISSEHTKDIYFKTGGELTALVKEEAQKLRQGGVDFVIYAIHDGYDENTAGDEPITVSGEHLRSYYDTALSDGYVDLVFEADTHYWYVLVDEEGVYHLQSGGNNAGVSHARVLIDKARGDSYILSAELLPASKYSHMEKDATVEELLEKYSEQIAPAMKILGSNGQYRNKDSICQLVADLYCAKGVEKWADRYDIVLGGGYMSCRSPGYLPAGEVSYSQLQSLLPFDNQITLCSIQGRDLIDKFLETDHYAYYIKTTEYGESIRSSIDPGATYYVVTDSYSAYYSYNNMTVIDVYAEDIFARDLVAEHITDGGLS